MKIDNSTPNVVIPTGDNTKRPDRPAPSGSNPEKTSENVHLSSLSSQLKALETKFSNSSVVDSGRVAEIKQAMSNGSFTVNAGAVADQLMVTVKDLIQSSKEKSQ